MGKDDKIKICIFAGGRGSATIADALLDHPRIDLTILVNAYDDGLSTGQLRRFIPGMLGPSDIRKNYSRMLRSESPSQVALRTLLEYRFPTPMDHLPAVEILAGLAQLSPSTGTPSEIASAFLALSLSCAQKISRALTSFLSYYTTQCIAGRHFDFGDCSLGNLIFAGCFRESSADFNATIRTFTDLERPSGRILNVTDGEALTLVALKADGTFLPDEASIVSKQSVSEITQIFLLRNTPSEKEILQLSQSALESRIHSLDSLSVEPLLNPEAKHALGEADLIIYGPGTQHSSLFPSYLTKDLGNTIALNEKAEKIFIANIRTDHEIQSETVDSLLHKVIYYLNEKGRVDWPSQQLVTRCFFQKVQDGIDSSGYVRFSRNRVQFRGTNLTESNWEGSSGAHLGGKVADEILALANEQAGLCLEPLPYMVSVIVPSLNEERTISQTLSALRLLNFAPLGVTKEIIVADGGSTDRTLALAQEEPSVRVLSVPQCRGRGHALRFGAEQALGNIIVFFPSDGEYEPRDLLPAVKVLIHNEFQVVFGSRAIKCVNVADRIRTIYQRNYLGYFIGHYGGMALSFISLLLHKRYVSDPLTGVKGFRRSAFRSLSLESNGLDLETEIIAKISHQGIFLLELPIEYFPRTKSQGKKTTVWDGLKALWALFRYRSRTYAKTVHRDTGLQRGGVHWNAPSIGQSS